MTDLPVELGAELTRALESKGYLTLTPVQAAVLRPELAGRDLRISSQTGSGKTVAVGIAIRDLVETKVPVEGHAAMPRAIVIAPTRELAKQVEAELRWLFTPLGAEVVSVTGGASYRDELRALARKPAVVVGTPGRLRDHLERGRLGAEKTAAFVLDEADRMLDMGFKDDLDAILSKAPEERRTILVSATFPREVRALADRIQRDPAFVEGTPLGAANADIQHLVHVVPPRQRLDAIVNLLLATPEAPSLIFVRTRADVAELSGLLQSAGFAVGALSGDMDQPERDRALAAFKRGAIQALVATDVAARGIDVQDIGRVIHGDPPDDADTYTHRSGRTGRAGQKGTSSVLVVPAAVRRVTGLLARAKVRWTAAPIPTAAELREAAVERLYVQLTDDSKDDLDESIWNLAKRLGKRSAEEDGLRTKILARLIARARVFGAAQPRDVENLTIAGRDRGPKPERAPRPRHDGERPSRARIPAERPSRARVDAERPSRARIPAERPSRARVDAERPSRARIPAERPSRARVDAERPARPPRDAERPARAPRTGPPAGGWKRFRVTWGGLHGADARRVVAMLCRRGGIQGSDIGAIDVQRTYSVVEIAGGVSERFAEAVAKPDPRDKRVKILRDDAPAAPRSPPERPSRRTLGGGHAPKRSR